MFDAIKGQHADRQLSIKPSERPAAPDNTWDYDRFNSWRSQVWKLIDDFADKAVQDAFLAEPPEYLVGDDLSWLDEIVLDVHGIDIDSKRVLAGRLQELYEFIRAVHGTSANSLHSYYTHGLQPLSLIAAQNHVREIFLTAEFPRITEAHIQRAIEKVGDVERGGRVYFETNERFFKKLCGHYLAYGSEYIQALASELVGSPTYKTYLKNRGMPTLFVCDVPMQDLSIDFIEDLAGSALENLFKCLQEGPNFKPKAWAAAGFCIRTPLEPVNIIGHCHPKVSEA